MSPHLTHQQFSAWLLGESHREIESHIRECPQCREELQRFQSSLKGFRSSVRQWSAGQLPPSLPMHVKQTPMQSWTMRLCLTAAAILFCVLIGHRVVQEQQAKSKADAALLAQIDQEVSQTVPGPMRPLTQLVSWDAGAAASTEAVTPTPAGQTQ